MTNNHAIIAALVSLLFAIAISFAFSSIFHNIPDSLYTVISALAGIALLFGPGFAFIFTLRVLDK